jgi:hypothetical protein
MKQRQMKIKPQRISVVHQHAPSNQRIALLNIAMHEKIGWRHTMHLFSHNRTEGKLQCPYKGCEKHFDKPTVITDTSTLPRQTHYACPYCMSKLEIITEKNKITQIKPTEYPTVFDSPAKCAHYSGLLNQPAESRFLQDECLVCPKVLQCNLRKK